MKVYKDFPIKGVDFMDINSELNDFEEMISMTSDLLLSIQKNEVIYNTPIDKIVAIESRGFLFGTELARFKTAGLALARKPGKLPGELVSVSYGTEYSDDTLEMQVSSISKGDRVLIHDDVLATGGTAKAVADLVHKLGGEVVGYSFIVEIGSLMGRDLLGKTEVATVIYKK